MMLIVILLSIILVMVVYLIFLFFFYKSMLDMEMTSSYECGFDPSSYTRMFFSYRFFLISILFIIFDVEISLMLPIPFLMEKMESLWIFSIFIFVLLMGLLYEYMCGSLNWLEFHN